MSSQSSVRALLLVLTLIAGATHGQDDNPLRDHNKAFFEQVSAKLGDAFAAPSLNASRVVELCSVIQSFWWSEDDALYFESSEGLYDQCQERLEQSDAPAALLFLLESSWDERVLEHWERAGNWPNWQPSEKSRLADLAASPYRADHIPVEDRREILRWSLTSDSENPLTRAALARLEMDAGEVNEAMELLAGLKLTDKHSHLANTVAALLLETRQIERAAAVFERFKGSANAWFDVGFRGRLLIAQDELDAARLEKLLDEYYNPLDLLSSWYTYALENHKTQAAREILNAHELDYDLALSERRRLWQHDGFGWSDIPAVLVTLAALLVVALVPGLVILPLHYRGLLRARNGNRPLGIGGDWTLRSAWIAGGLMLICQLVVVGWFAPDLLDQLLSEETDISGIATSNAAQGICWALVIQLALMVALSYRNLGRLGFGSWSVGKSVGLSFLAMIGLMTVAGISRNVFAPDIDPATTGQVFITGGLLTSVAETYGGLVLLLMVAIVGPLSEELLFRGIALHAFSRHISFGFANVIQAGAFAAIHELTFMMPYLFLVGLTAGYMVRKSGGLMPAILLHVMINALASFALIAASG